MTFAFAAAPTAPNIRHDLLDALRGFALAGVLLVNIVTLSLYELLPAPVRAGCLASWRPGGSAGGAADEPAGKRLSVRRMASTERP